MVELEFHRHVVVEEDGSLPGRINLTEPLEKEPVALADSHQFYGLRIVVKMAGGNDPWRKVAVVKGAVVHEYITSS